jgi:hypothetical protein
LTAVLPVVFLRPPSSANIFSDRQPSTAEVESTLSRLLAHHEKLSGVERKKKKLNRLSPNY